MSFFPLVTPAFEATNPVRFAEDWEIYVRPRGGVAGEEIDVYAAADEDAEIFSQPLYTGPAGRIGREDEIGWVKGGDLPLDLVGRVRGSKDPWQTIPEGDSAVIAGGAAAAEFEEALDDKADLEGGKLKESQVPVPVQIVSAAYAAGKVANDDAPAGTKIARNALLRGRATVAEEATAVVLAQPPTLTFDATGFGVNSITKVPRYAEFTQLPGTVELCSWKDSRFRYLGGQPVAYTGAGYEESLGCAVVKASNANGILRDGKQYCVTFDFDGEAFEILCYANATQWFRIWVDGRPHAAEPVVMEKTGGLMYLLKVALPSRKKRTIKIELEAMLFGGIVCTKTDTISPPNVGRGPRLLLIGDSYSSTGIDGPSEDTRRVTDNYGWRLGRRLGYDDLWIDGVGGTGVASALTVPPGLPYGERAERWPETTDVVLVSGSINDASKIGDGTITQAQLKTKTKELLQALRLKYPVAPIFLTSTMRPGKPTANDESASAAYKAAFEEWADGNSHYLDQIAAGWFGGTGKVGTTKGDGNADYYLASDGNHPSTAGHLALGDRLAAAITSALGLPVQESTPWRNLPRLSISYGGEQKAKSGEGTALLANTANAYINAGPMWAVATPTRILIPISGFYRIGAATSVPAAVGGTQRLISLRLNGATVFARAGAPFSASASTWLQIERTRHFNAGDYIEAQGYQDSGGELLLGFGSVQINELWGELVAPDV